MFTDGLSGPLAGSVGADHRGAVSVGSTGPVGLSRANVAAMRALLERLDPTVDSPEPRPPDHDGTRGLTQAQCIDLLRELEDLKAAAAGAQVAVTAHLSAARLDAEQAAGVPAAKRGKGLAGEVALARRISPHRGGQHLGMARALGADMPCTLAALRRGELSEWRATLLVRESICLSAQQRRDLDAELWRDRGALVGAGDQRLVAMARRLAYRLDPHSVVDRAARAERDRFVSIRPAPDTMAYLTALLPVGQAVAAFAALGAAADSARAAGDGRGRGQVMADTLVSRVTGSDADVPARVELQLVMTDHSLLGADEEPAQVPGYGTAPAGWARSLLRRALGDTSGCRVYVRRLFTDPAGHLVAMESRSRTAPPGLARYVAARDAGRCRTPYCDAPVRHIDHVVDHANGGATAEQNLEGYCERCNYTKSAPGWRASPVSSGDPPGDRPRAGPTVATRTPTGHTYTSPVPRLPHTG